MYKTCKKTTKSFGICGIMPVYGHSKFKQFIQFLKKNTDEIIQKNP